ncbi:MAG: AAA family ATPase [Pirellulales bacterium]|nr:AAA family ATPase [Pirellulales bacterium]
MNDALLEEFRLSLAECRELYDAAGEECLRSHQHLVSQSAKEFRRLLDDLHRGLLIKVFISIVRADWRWASEERELARVFVQHLWEKSLHGAQLKKAFKRLMEQEELLTWESLLRPFSKYPPLREHAGEVETTVVRIANIIAKADGDLHEKETTQLRSIQKELEQRLYREIERKQESADSSVSSKREFAGSGAATVVPLEAVDERGKRPQPLKKLDEEKQPRESPLSREQQLAAAMAELNEMTGLDSIKQEIRELVNFLKIQEEREKQNLPKTDVSLHMVYYGNPGTGKTTVARVVGRILGAMGVLTKGHAVETDRSGLVAQYAGQTGPKTHKQIDAALDGVLFIDEAYSLVADSREDPYGGEAVQAILKRMEDDRHRLVVIIAGYPEPMERLLQSNPGLSSRFGRRLRFPDYSAQELGQIFAGMCEKNHYILPRQTRAKLLLGFQRLLDERDEHFGNGRLARNVFEGAIRRLANRIADVKKITRELLTTLEADDILFPTIPDDVWSDLDKPERKFAIACPQCEKPVRIEQQHLGEQVTCEACSHVHLVEWANPASESAR